MKVAFVGCLACAVISMASKRDVLFNLSHNIMVLTIASTALVLRGNPVWQGFLWFLNPSDYGNAGFEFKFSLKVVSVGSDRRGPDPPDPPPGSATADH